MKKDLHRSETLASIAIGLIEDPDDSFEDLGSIELDEIEYRFGLDSDTEDLLMVVGYGEEEISYEEFLVGPCDGVGTIAIAVAEYIQRAFSAREVDYVQRSPALSGPIAEAGFEEAVNAEMPEHAFLEALDQLLLEYGVDHTEVTEGVEK